MAAAEVIVYDIESLRLDDAVEGGWDNPAGFGFGTAVLYSYVEDRYFFYGPGDQEVCEMKMHNKVVVGYNSLRFDNSIMLGNDYTHGDTDFGPNTCPWRNIDLLEVIIQYKFNVNGYAAAVKKMRSKWKVLDGSLSLDAVCRATLGVSKSGKGALAPAMIASGQWAGVFSYNLHDVRLTRQLFEFIGRNRYVIDGKGNRIDIPKWKWSSNG